MRNTVPANMTKGPGQIFGIGISLCSTITFLSMKDSLSIALIVFAVVFAGFRWYQKLQGKTKPGNPGRTGKEDDYEPYSKK